MGTANIGHMPDSNHTFQLPKQLEQILADSFYIRTTFTRKNGTPRTIETTYVWIQENGVNKIILSGYPGKRDWVASIAQNSNVTIHSVEFEPWFDIPADAVVIRDLNEKLPRILAFIEH